MNAVMVGALVALVIALAVILGHEHRHVCTEREAWHEWFAMRM